MEDLVGVQVNKAEDTLFSVLGDMEIAVGRMDDLVREVNRLRDGFGMAAPEPEEKNAIAELNGLISGVTVMDGRSYVESFRELVSKLNSRIGEVGEKVHFVRNQIG